MTAPICYALRFLVQGSSSLTGVSSGKASPTFSVQPALPDFENGNFVITQPLRAPNILLTTVNFTYVIFSIKNEGKSLSTGNSKRIGGGDKRDLDPRRPRPGRTGAAAITLGQPDHVSSTRLLWRTCPLPIHDGWKTTLQILPPISAS